VGWLSFADGPGDSDDARLRKRVGIVAGYLTIVAPLTVPLQAGIGPITLGLGVGLSVFSAANLLVLAATQRFDRYVVALLASGAVFVPAVTTIGGGITGSSAGLEWDFLVPAYAILALGPRRATPWFVIFVVSVALLALVDPWVKANFGSAGYQAVLVDSVINALAPLGIVFLLLRWTDTRRRAAEDRSEALLTNAIPSAIAERLKRGEDRIAETYPATTVLFADIAGFTPWAGATDPDRVVGLLDDLFGRFDTLAGECGMEKIKTIGDAYMAVAGAPLPQPDHAGRALELGRRMLRAFGEWASSAGLDLQLRVGLASGPVVGGVIGKRRILFDLWGATVNAASRMQSHGVPGRIQVTDSTWQLIRASAAGVARQVEVKGLGDVTVHLIGD
jgi:adenylate cyclase